MDSPELSPWTDSHERKKKTNILVHHPSNHPATILENPLACAKRLMSTILQPSYSELERCFHMKGICYHHPAIALPL